MERQSLVLNPDCKCLIGSRSTSLLFVTYSRAQCTSEGGNEFEKSIDDKMRKVTGVALQRSVKWSYRRTVAQKFGRAEVPVTESSSIILTPERQEIQNNNPRHI